MKNKKPVIESVNTEELKDISEPVPAPVIQKLDLKDIQAQKDKELVEKVMSIILSIE